MLNEVVKKWVKTLRSGEYKQGHSRLRYNDTYCCLGVLCELAVQEGVIPPAEYSREYDTYTYFGHPNYLPVQVRQWAGLRDSHSEFRDGNHKLTLASLNDAGKTFTEIANVIESEPPGLFEKEF